jgi:hypothetical protein
VWVVSVVVVDSAPGAAVVLVVDSAPGAAVVDSVVVSVAGVVISGVVLVVSVLVVVLSVLVSEDLQPAKVKVVATAKPNRVTVNNLDFMIAPLTMLILKTTDL